MKKFHNHSSLKDRWFDPKNTKNNPKSCTKAHPFCHLEYEWGDDSSQIKQLNYPINSSLPNVELPSCNEGNIYINYDSITEENLDDWIAQSLNRNINSMLNPNKKYFIPHALETDLENRYKNRKSLKIVQQQQTYFKNEKARNKTKSYVVGQKRKKLQVTELYFDYKQLTPHPQISGTAIRVRQKKKQPKEEIKRRNAVLLSEDVHYERLQKELSKEKLKRSPDEKKQEKIMVEKKQQKMYSYNIESLSRKNCYESVPNSLIEKQITRVKEPRNSFLNANKVFFYKQADGDEKFREQINVKAKKAIQMIGQLANEDEGNKDMNFPIYNLATTQIKRQGSISKHEIKAEGKEKKKLEGKVMKLLNNMQVTAEKIDVNMVKFNVHGQEIFLKTPDLRPHVKWILKAQEKIKSQETILAIDYYKQAIILQPEFFIPVFNIAVLLEKCNMLDSARLWFNLASQFQSDSENVSFGISLVALKQLNFANSLKQINNLITKLESTKKKVQLVYYYIRALSYKQLNMYQQARNDYHFVAKQSQPSNYNVLSYFIFSMVYSKLRRAPIVFDSLSFIKFRETMFLVLYQNKKPIKEQKEDIKDIGLKIIQLPFLRNFSISLINKMLTFANYQRIQKNDILFENEQQTIIIINGIVSMRSHEQNFRRPDTVGVLKQGGIIGNSQIDHITSSKPNIWYIAQSDVEVIRLPRNNFNDFWKGVITFDFDFKYNFLRNIALFRGLPQSTLLKLCEICEKKTYEKNTILFNDCSYRIQLLNKKGHGFGMGKNQATDQRFLNYRKVGNEDTRDLLQQRGRCRIYNIIKKNVFKFNNLKFNRLKYPGLLIIVKGSVEIQNDLGFRCNNLIGQKQFFGQSLIIQTQGLQNYGRLVVESQELQAYLIDVEKLVWAFTEDDKQIMIKNNQKRQVVETIRFLSNHFKELIHTKLSLKRKMEQI